MVRILGFYYIMTRIILTFVVTLLVRKEGGREGGREGGLWCRWGGWPVLYIHTNHVLIPPSLPLSLLPSLPYPITALRDGSAPSSAQARHSHGANEGRMCSERHTHAAVPDPRTLEEERREGGKERW